MYESVLKEAKRQMPEIESSIEETMGMPEIVLSFPEYKTHHPIRPGDAENPKEFIMDIARQHNVTAT